jgi:hypothetical protein
MSPVALQEDAWTHFPPWQFVEQHSVPVLQAFPSVVQVAVLPDTVIAAHWPFVHVPEQHWDAVVQLWPTDAQAPLAHVPFEVLVAPVQVRLQQSASRLHAAPAAAQNWVELHLPLLQAVEQQSAFVVQLSPPDWQAFWTGVVQVPLLHWPEQQALAVEQLVPPARHWLVGSTQTFDAHEFVQQSELDAQTWPVALHCVASTHLPLQAPEQQSEGSVHVAWRALQLGPPPVVTVMLTPAVVPPAEFVAVTTYVATAATVVGIPETTPVAVFKLRPAGSAGETE